VELAVVKPLKVTLVLRDLTLLWQFVPVCVDVYFRASNRGTSRCESTEGDTSTERPDITMAVCTCVCSCVF